MARWRVGPHASILPFVVALVCFHPLSLDFIHVASPHCSLFALCFFPRACVCSLLTSLLCLPPQQTSLLRFCLFSFLLLLFVCWVYFHTSDTLAVGAQPLNGCKQSKHMLHADKKQSSSRATRQRTRGQEDIKAGSLWWWWRWGHSEPQMVDSYTSPWSVEMVVVVTASDAKSMTFALGSSSQSSCTCLDGDDCDGCCCCCC